MNRARNRAPAWPFVAIYLAFSILLVVALFQLRSQVVDSFEPQRDSTAWARWREATETADETTTTARKAVTTQVPPGYLLLKDHFLACVIGAWLTSSVPVGVTLWLVRSLLTPGRPNPAAVASSSDSQKTSSS